MFGIPGDSVTAIVIGVLLMKNVRPGPTIFQDCPELLFSVYFTFIVANLVLLPLGYLAIRAGGLLVHIPRRVLLPVIILFSTVGAFAINNDYFDIWVMLAMGLLGFVLDAYQVPLGPVVLGLILGDDLERYFIQSITKSEGSLTPFVDTPHRWCSCPYLSVALDHSDPAVVVVAQVFNGASFGLSRRDAKTISSPDKQGILRIRAAAVTLHVSRSPRYT